MDLTGRYIAVITDKLTPSSIKQTQTIFAKIEELGAKRLEVGYTKEEYIQLIENLSITTGRAFTQYKVAIKRYVDWLIEQGVLPQKCSDAITSVSITDISINSLYSEKYYRNFEELEQTIEDTLALSDAEDWMAYGTSISALYLAWFGVAIDDAVQILQDDVGEDGIIVNGTLICPNPKAMAVIHEYKDADGYTVYNGFGPYTRRYKKSNHLLRTYKAEHMNKRSLTALISDFSISGGSDRNFLSYKKVYQSGIYNSAYQWEIANGKITVQDIGTLSKLFKEDYKSLQKAYATLRDYNNFKRFLIS